MRDHVEQLAGGKHIDAAQLRLTVEARKAQAKELVDAGLSNREAAKQLGVSRETVRRDLAQNVPKPAQNVPSKTKPLPPIDQEEERKQQRWAATRNPARVREALGDHVKQFETLIVSTVIRIKPTRRLEVLAAA